MYLWGTVTSEVVLDINESRLPPHPRWSYSQDTAPIVAALAKALPDVLNASVAELNFKNVVNQLGDVMYTFPFSLPPYYIAIIRCLGVLEGVALQVRGGVRNGTEQDN